MILKGEKKEEYREANPYWNKRMEKWTGDPFKQPPFYTIKFINGYSENSPYFTIVCESFHTRNTVYHKEWGEDLFENKEHYVFNLGTIINK